jgi:hypothetical protein
VIEDSVSLVKLREESMAGALSGCHRMAALQCRAWVLSHRRALWGVGDGEKLDESDGFVE